MLLQFYFGRHDSAVMVNIGKRESNDVLKNLGARYNSNKTPTEHWTFSDLNQIRDNIILGSSEQKLRECKCSLLFEEKRPMSTGIFSGLSEISDSIPLVLKQYTT